MLWTFIKNLTLREAILGGICVLLFVGVIFLSKSLYTAHSELEKANGQIMQYLLQNVALNDALVTQNSSIGELNKQSEIAMANSEAQLKIAQTKNRSLQNEINNIQAAKVVNCEDTSEIVANVINALKNDQ